MREGKQVGMKKEKSLRRDDKRTAEEEGKATREVTPALNNSSFKNQSEALIGAVA